MKVRLQQISDRLLNRLFAIPLLLVFAGIALSLVTLWIDQRLDGSWLPRSLQTTVDSARAVLSTIAGGLITSVTLLLSLMLVAVQLASSQFSPRTLRSWLGDRAQQVTIGVVLATAVYCLMVLRATRTLADGGPETEPIQLVPHIGVLVALTLGIVSLILVVRSVDRLTDSLRIGGVGQRIMARTLATIAKRDVLSGPEDDVTGTVGRRTQREPDAPASAIAVETLRGGWVQQIDDDALFSGLPDGATAWITAPLGTYVLPDSPLLRVELPEQTQQNAPGRDGDDEDEDDDHNLQELRNAFAIGDGRTMQQDVDYGIVRLTDIAVRALSPGVNDPNTATDMVVHLGVVLLRLWEKPDRDPISRRDGRALVRRELRHGDYLRAAMDPIRRYGAGDPSVVVSMIDALAMLRREVIRRSLPGPIEPIDEMIDDLLASAEDATLLPRELAELRRRAHQATCD